MSTNTNTTITLDETIKRDGGDITTVDVRRPTSGELRGLSLSELLNTDVNSLFKLLPRVTQPTLTEAELKKLNPSDLVQLGGAVVNFLAPKAVLEQSLTE